MSARTTPKLEQDLAHEFEYLVSLTKSYVLAEQPLDHPPCQLDWSVFNELCSLHKVAGTLLPLIPRTNLNLDICNQIDHTMALPTETATLNLMLLERILPCLEEAGCHPLVLKGGVLAPLYYKKPEQRYLADLDILVPVKLVATACAVMEDLGLHLTETVADPAYYRDHHFHWIMNNDVGFVVEIHWDLTTPDCAVRFDLAELRGRSRTLSLNNTTMRILAPIDHLLHIVIQCTEGGFCEMRRVIDAALLLRAIDNTTELAKRALEQNQGTALWLVLDQVERWTGSPVPMTLKDQLAPGKKAARMLRHLANKSIRGKEEFRHFSEIHNLLHWGCLPTPSLRRQAIVRFLTPGQEYWLELGFSPQNIPGWAAQLRLRLSRLSILTYLITTGVMTSRAR